MIRYLVLGFLLDGKPRHGHALMKDAHAKMRLLANSGSFYRELRLLERNGLIAVHQGGAREDARRTSYVITPAGRDAFLTWLRSSTPDLRSAEDDLSARALFIGEPVQPDDLQLLQKWQDRLWLECKILERDRDELLESCDDPASSWRLELLLTRRVARAAADLEFLASLREGIERSLAVSQAAGETVPEGPPAEVARAPEARREPPRRVAGLPRKLQKSV